MKIEPFMPLGTVEPLDISVLRWLAGLYVYQRYSLAISPVY